jgi:hypothetical protein
VGSSNRVENARAAEPPCATRVRPGGRILAEHITARDYRCRSPIVPTTGCSEIRTTTNTASAKSKIIFLTQESAPAFVREASTLGAAGYVAKRTGGSDLLTALDAVLGGGQFVSTELSAQEFTTQATMLISSD